MTIDSRFVLSPPIQGYFVDKDTGAPLSGGVVKFWRDASRTVPKSVYEITGTYPAYTYTDLGNEITLTSVGTWGNNSGADIALYLFPYQGTPSASNGTIDLYFVEVFSSTGVPQESRVAWPNLTSSSPASTFADTDNILSNSQFVVVNFDTTASTATLSMAGTQTVTNIAPDWDFVTNGTGSVTIARGAITDTSALTNPPYSLKVTASSGITKFQLRQRLTNTPRLFSGGYVSATFAAASLDSLIHTFTMNYVPSATGTPLPLVSVSTTVDNLWNIPTTNPAVLITPPNTGAAPSAYIDILIDLPIGVQFQVSSFQLCGVEDSGSVVGYLQQPVARQVDHLYNYYNLPLQNKPIPGYLAGWNFPTNPAQELGDTVAASAIGANKSKYVWDQTILFQSANSGIGITRGASGGIVLTAAANSQAALIQYLPQEKAREILHNSMSVNIAAFCSAAAGLKATVSLWYTTDANLPNVKSATNNSLVLTLDANGKPASFNGTWTEVPRLNNVGDAACTIAQKGSTEQFTDYPFIGWDAQGVAGVNTATFFAIVIGTAQMTTADTLTVYDVNLCPGNIATRSAPKSADEVLRECQYYYEMSYNTGTIPGAATLLNAIQVRALIDPAEGTTTNAVRNAYARSFVLQYKQSKVYASPTIVLYSPLGANLINQVEASIRNGGAEITNGSPLSNFWTQDSPGKDEVQFLATSVSILLFTGGAIVGNFAEALVIYHYTIDARLGTF